MVTKLDALVPRMNASADQKRYVDGAEDYMVNALESNTQTANLSNLKKLKTLPFSLGSRLISHYMVKFGNLFYE